jgi:uncharacterized protein YndB with AHSA1/START domain
MATTRVTQHVRAPRAAVYRALLDGAARAAWMMPDGMTSNVHRFDARVGGGYRISLTYDAPTSTGKTSAHTDTFHGTFVELVPDTCVVEQVEFETQDPAMQGTQTVTYELVDRDGGTDVTGTHDDLPPGIPPADNELGWRMSLAKLAARVERG